MLSKICAMGLKKTLGADALGLFLLKNNNTHLHSLTGKFIHCGVNESLTQKVYIMLVKQTSPCLANNLPVRVPK